MIRTKQTMTRAEIVSVFGEAAEVIHTQYGCWIRESAKRGAAFKSSVWRFWQDEDE